MCKPFLKCFFKQPSCTRKYTFQKDFSGKDTSRPQTTHASIKFSQILRNLQLSGHFRTVQFLWLARSRASHYVTLKKLCKSCDGNCRLHFGNCRCHDYYAIFMSAIFTKSQLATLAEILDGIFHLKQTVSYFSQYICVYNLRICHL